MAETFVRKVLTFILDLVHCKHGLVAAISIADAGSSMAVALAFACSPSCCYR
jgi:hypothetical protein